METEIPFNHISTDFTGILNLSEVSTEFLADEYTFRWTNEEIARLIQVIFRPMLIVLGTIGNGLSFYIMQRSSLKDVSSCFYMSLLALADTSKYISALLTNKY